jgi:hypothetical protein
MTFAQLKMLNLMAVLYFLDHSSGKIDYSFGNVGRGRNTVKAWLSFRALFSRLTFAGITFSKLDLEDLWQNTDLTDRVARL